jgi:uncharacterized membrane protein YqjE
MENSRSRIEPILQVGVNSSPADWITILRTLRSASDAIFEQALLHGQLAKVEWMQEKHRLTTMLFALLFGFACFISLLLFAGILVIALSWTTDYLIAAIATLCCLYGLMLYIAWRRLISLNEAAAASFIDTRTEIAADIALLRSKLA